MGWSLSQFDSPFEGRDNSITNIELDTNTHTYSEWEEKSQVPLFKNKHEMEVAQ